MIYVPDSEMAAELDRQAVDVPPEGFHLPDDEIESFLSVMSASPHHASESADAMRQRAIYFVLWKHYGLPQDDNAQTGRKFMTDQRVILLHEATRRIHKHDLPEIQKSIDNVGESLCTASDELRDTVSRSSSESAAAIVAGVEKSLDHQSSSLATSLARVRESVDGLRGDISKDFDRHVTLAGEQEDRAAKRADADLRQVTGAIEQSAAALASSINASATGSVNRASAELRSVILSASRSALESMRSSTSDLATALRESSSNISSGISSDISAGVADICTHVDSGFRSLHDLFAARESARVIREKHMTETLFRWGKTASRVVLAWMILVLILLSLLVVFSGRSHAQNSGIDCIYVKNADGTTARNFCAPFSFNAGTGVSWTTATGNLTLNTSGSSVTPAGNSLISGGGIVWVSGYSYLVSAATYTIQGIQYASSQTQVTLPAADPTNDRVDLIVANTSNAVTSITGTPSANPVVPGYDPNTQIPLGFVLVNANTTQPPSVTDLNIYLNNAEWTCTGSATVNCNDTTNPYQGTKDIKVTTSATNDFINLANGSPINPANYNNLAFYIQNISVNSKRNLTLQWRLNGSVVGSPVVVSNGLYGYSVTNTSTYQQVVIPVSNFALAGSTADTVRITIGGSGGNPSFYLDNIILQAGGSQPSTPTNAMIWKGTWSSSTAYNANDAVVYNFVTYVCLVGNTNVIPYGNTTQWASLGGFPVHQFSFGVPGVLTASQEVGLGSTPFALTFPANFSGSTGFIGPNGANPTASNTITIKKNVGGVLTTIGTVVIATNGTYTFTTTGGTTQSLGAGDGLIAVNQTPADLTLASPAFTLVGYLGPVGPNVSFAGAGGAITGPVSTTVDDIMTWGNTSGGTTKDSSVKISTTIQNNNTTVPTGAAVQLGKLPDEKHTASSSSELDFTSCLSSSYDTYFITFENVLPATDNANLYMQMSTAGGGYDTTAANYKNGYYYVQMDGAGVGNCANNCANTWPGFMIHNANNPGMGINGFLYLHNPLSASLVKSVEKQLAVRVAGGYYHFTGGGIWNVTTAANQFRFIESTGAIASGTIRCYGVVN